MEEILASIRKIIAEDASGSRVVPPAPPRNNGIKSASSAQRGFMSREAFMRSSAPQEESDNQRYFTPVTPHDPQPAHEPTAKAEPLANSDKVDSEPAPAVALEAEKPSPKVEPKQHNQLEIETATVVEVEQANLKSLGAVEPEKEKHPKAASEAAIVDAQIDEHSSEDLKVLRDGESHSQASELDAKGEVRDSNASEALADLPQKQAALASKSAAEPASPVSTPAAKDPAPAIESQDSSDPFAFDLGPSPFLLRPSAERAVDPKISIEPASDAVPTRPREPSRAEPSPYSGRETSRINGTSMPSEPGRYAFSPPKSYEPKPAASPSSARPAAPFAVPSVSATLGPHRRLEPLSNAFKPAPSDDPRARSELHSADPYPRQYYTRDAEIPAESREERRDSMLQHAPAQPPAPPQLDTAANAVSNLDRTIEDAVADLLRPLLKTWLAENMPKIVERALRREMSERLLPDHKSGRD
jgi:cell pole-organizing protein PopZ